MNDESKPFAVELWGSHPDDDNDDCWTSVSFATLEEARNAAKSPETFPFPSYASSKGTAALRVVRDDGTDDAIETFEVVMNPGFVPRHERDDDREWRNESQMQSAMGHGVQGWNDYEGE